MSSNWKPNQSRFSLDSSRPYGIMLENPKKHGAPGNYFCLKIIAKLAIQ